MATMSGGDVSAGTLAGGAAAVTLRDVGKVFPNGTRALDGLDLVVAAGEFVSLLGPSGCGKSTALRIMAGLSPPSGGEVGWSLPGGGRPARPGGAVGFVFQDPTLMPWRTVFANVQLPLQLAGRGAAPARDDVMSALAAVGLADVADAFPRQLSGGMKMRVSIARALVTRPSLLLMDEPFAALDEITRQGLNEEMLGLWRQWGLSVVFVTHSVYEAAYLSSRVVVMTPRPGRAFAEFALGTPRERGPDYRQDARYAGDCERISAGLRAAMQAGRDAP